jgi:hypothetical protein
LILNGLSDDDNLSGIFSCHFRELPSGKSFYVHASGPTSELVRRAGATIVDRNGLIFDGVSFSPRTYSLKSGRGDQFVSEGLSPESALFEKVRPVQHVMSQSQQYYQRGLNPIFDLIVAEGDASPLFRGYLQYQFGSILLNRPHEWGSVLSPQLIADLERLGEIGARSLSSSGWMAMDLGVERNRLIREFYAGAPHRHYALEAKLNRRLIERTLEIGFGYAGFVDVGGELVLASKVAMADVLYGHSDAKEPCRPLFRRPSGELAEPGEAGGEAARWEALVGSAPLTALFYFKGDRTELLADAAADLGIPVEEARAVALPFFTSEQQR